MPNYQKDDWAITPERLHAAYLRGKKERWAFPHKASVIHPKIGEVIVPCASQFAAVLCACELFHLKFMDIHDAEVWSTD